MVLRDRLRQSETLSYTSLDWVEPTIGENGHSNCENNLPGGSQTIIRNHSGNLAVESMFSSSAEYSLLTRLTNNYTFVRCIISRLPYEAYSVEDSSNLCSGESGGGGGESPPPCTWAGHCLGIHSAPECLEYKVTNPLGS